MTDQEITIKILECVRPYAKNKEAFDSATAQSRFIEDLEVNSARRIDILLDLETKFNISIEDELANSMRSVGDALAVVKRKLA